MYENLLADKTAAELRKLGAQYGIPGAAKAKKADLIVKIAAAMEQERIERERAVNPASIDANVSEHPTTDPETNAKITAAEETPREEFQRLTSLPLAEQTKKVQARIRKLSNLPENTGPREEAETPLSEQTAAQLRETARKLGLSPSAKMPRNKLIGLIYAKTTPATPTEEAAASEAPAETSTETGTAAPAKPSRKNVCRSCGTRSIGTGSGDSNDRDTAKAVVLCVPCHEEAQWENEHADRAHDSLPADSEERAGCWICKPELNRASADYVGRAGTSRSGMVINVPLRADGKTKAVTVAEKLAAMKIEAKIKRYKGQEILTADLGGTPLKLVWDSRGRYVYAESTFNSRKVRNVSEALRLAARKVDAGQ